MSELMGMKSVNSALRDSFAMEAFKPYVAHSVKVFVNFDDMAKVCYALADAMMAAREEKREA